MRKIKVLTEDTNGCDPKHNYQGPHQTRLRGGSHAGADELEASRLNRALTEMMADSNKERN